VCRRSTCYFSYTRSSARAAQILLGDNGDLGAERSDVDASSRFAESDQRIGERGGIAGCAGDKKADRAVAQVFGEPDDEAEIDAADEGASSGLIMMMLPGCGSAWKKPSSNTIFAITCSALRATCLRAQDLRFLSIRDPKKRMLRQTKRLFVGRPVDKRKGAKTESCAFDKPQLRRRRPVGEEPSSPAHNEGLD
jgi:hypothetical protein